MKHKTWFRLVIKAIGIALIAYSLPQLLGQIGTVIWIALRDPWGSGMGINWLDIYLSQFMGPGLAAVFMFIIGLYLFFGGGLIVNLCIPSNRSYCPNCGYELARPDVTQCSECGIVLPTQDDDGAPANETDESATASNQTPAAQRTFVQRMVPYQNSTALLAYYLAIASFIPILGLILAPIAIGCGTNGLKRAHWSPGKGGAAHAWIAIVLAAMVLFAHGIGFCFILAFYNF